MSLTHCVLWHCLLVDYLSHVYVYIFITCKTRKETIPSMQRIGCYTMFGLVEEGIGMHARCKRMYDTMVYKEQTC